MLISTDRIRAYGGCLPAPRKRDGPKQQKAGDAWMCANISDRGRNVRNNEFRGRVDELATTESAQSAAQVAEGAVL